MSEIKRLFIAEKPELARAIVEGLGGGTTKRGYTECANGDVVTWCFGHMLALKDPEDYDPSYKEWKMDQLPMKFIPWAYKIGPDKEDQLTTILELMKKSSTVVHSCDADDEGQAIVDEILEYACFKGGVLRLLINDLNLKAVQKSLANLRPNSEFKGLFQSALARTVGDQLYGYNMTRCYTLAAQQEGYQGVLSLGRVQTAILGMVVRRDLEHEAHVKSYFYTVSGEFSISGIQLPAKYVVKDTDPIDEDKRLVDETFALQIATDIHDRKAVVKSIKTTGKKNQPPLPYNLLKLQTDASRKFGIKPDRVQEITQDLREKHKLITYNRSDCQYLSDEHFESSPAILEAVAQTAGLLAPAIQSANTKLKSKAFDATKITAHHAIIPTETIGVFSKLSDEEQKIYMLIARAFIAQFYPAYEYDETKLSVVCEGHEFACTTKNTTKQGWKLLYKNDKGNEEVETDGDSVALDISALKTGTAGVCVKGVSEKKETAPPPRYTMATLLTDLTRVAKYIRDPKLKALMIEKDKGKEGEHGGIGTPATRASILVTLSDRGYVTEQGKSIVSTKIARELYALLPDEIRYPDMTAIWHEQQKEIQKGQFNVESFLDSLMEFISAEVNKVKATGLKLTIKKYNCPHCHKVLRRLNGTKGPFWACSGFAEGCKTTFEDKGGFPQMTKTTALPASSIHKCNLCKSGLRRTKGPKSWFWSCSGYPTCTQAFPELAGKPDLTKPKVK